MDYKLPFLVCVCVLSTASAQLVCRADIALVIDNSGSIRDTNQNGIDNWQTILSFLVEIVRSDIVNLQPDGTNFAAVGFGNSAETYFDFNELQTVQNIERIVSTLNYKGGNTNTTGGLKHTRERIFIPSAGDRQGVNNIIILLTDGVPTRDVEQLPGEVETIKNQNIRIIGIGVTAAVNEEELKKIVTNPDTDYFSAEEFDRLQEILNDIVNQACTTDRPPEITPSPTGPCANRADLYFVLDGSGSIYRSNFELMKEFVISVVSDLTIDDGRVQVGLTLFSTNNNNEFSLNRYNTRNEIIDHVNNILWPEGTTNTAAAIRYVRQNGFTSGNGDRSDVGNVMIIITDGGSNTMRDTLEEAHQARKQGIHIIVMGVGGWTNEAELIGMASHPYDVNKVDVRNFGDLGNFKDQLQQMICNNVDDCNPNLCQNGGQCVDGIGYFSCICPSGRAGPRCERQCREGADVVVAMDASGSIGKVDFQKQADFVQTFFQGLNMDADSRGALETYSDAANTRFNLNEFQSKNSILNGLGLYYDGGTTNTQAAVSRARNNMFTSSNGDRSGNRNVLFVITDGRSNDPAATWREARSARAAGINIVVMAVGNNIRQTELNSLASWPVSDNVIRANNFDSLSSQYDAVMNAVCNNENECNSNPCGGNGQCTDIINDFSCRCNDGRSGIRCERRCDNEYDIALIMDVSGSIRRERMGDVQDFLANIVEQFEVGSDRARFALISFSDQAALQFNLNEYTTKQDVISAIYQVPWVGGRTNTADALRIMNDNVFTGTGNDRSNVPNFAVVATDGGSNINPENTIPEAIRAKIESGVHMISVGIGQDINQLEIRGLASEPVANNVILAPSFNDLPNRVSQVVSATCDSVNECNNNPCSNNGRCQDRLGTFHCLCNDPYVGERCDSRVDTCGQQRDIIFVLDFSGSMDIIYDIIIAFTKQMVYQFRVQSDRTRFGVLFYADNAVIRFHLNEYNTKEEILAALSFGQAGGQTNTAEAIRIMYNDMFTSSRGDRSGIQNVGVVVTDGGSNINRANTANEAQNARGRGIDMFVAAIGDNPAPDMGEVNDIASNPDNEYVVRVENAARVNQAAQELRDLICRSS